MYIQDYLAVARRKKDIANNTISPVCFPIATCLDEASLTWHCTPHVYQAVCVPEQSAGAYLPIIISRNDKYPSCVADGSTYCVAFSNAFSAAFGF